MRRRPGGPLVLLLVTLFAAPLEAAERPITIRGYVTRVLSPTSFEVGGYTIVRDAASTPTLQNPGADVPFGPDDVRTGVEVEITGALDEEAREVRASAIAVDLEQFRWIEQSVVLASPLDGLVEGPDGWEGLVVAGGQHIRITQGTTVRYRPLGRGGPPGFLISARDLAAGVTMHYRGRRELASGHVVADAVEFEGPEPPADPVRAPRRASLRERLRIAGPAALLTVAVVAAERAASRNDIQSSPEPILCPRGPGLRPPN